ncbi:MucBP domain-containing protein [Enterococcus sp. AZ196]|uniref:MucBP domain-containing protein n=1 Tax=Enterococcus sp. AZ196 TaxID=2774659 RepID=UPI003D2DD059
MKRLKLVVLLVLSLCFSVLIASGEEANAADMHRLYNPNSGEHFYTAASGEKNHLVKVGWKYEGIGWTSPENGSAVYRLYNPNAGDHHYTMNVGEKNHLVKVGWKYEGIGWYSDTKKAVPLYRAYNPNAKAGSHNYTVNYAEQQNLLRVGWKNEGIAWYGIKKAVPVTKYTVTVKHVGSDGKLLKSATVNVEKGKSHTAKAESFSGYTIKGSSSQTVVVNGNKTITFNYTKNVTPVTKYTVTVKYVDSAGKEIEKALTASVEKGKTYKATGKVISGYTLKGNDSQIVTVDGNKTITFTYTKNVTPVTKYTVTVKHVGSDGKELKKTTVLVEKGKAHTEKAETFAGYTLNSKETQTISAVNADQTLTFNYTKNKYTITVKYTDSIGNNIKTATTQIIEHGKSFSMTAPDITGYTVVPADKTKTIASVSKNETVTFRYTKNPAVKYKITVKYVDTENNTIKAATTESVEKGKAYTVTAPTITGYTVKGNNTQTISSVTSDVTLTFVYNNLAFDKVTLHAIVDGRIVKSITFKVKSGEVFNPSLDKLDLDPTKYDLSLRPLHPVVTGKGGRELEFNFEVTPFKNYVTQEELQIMQQTIIDKVNELRTTSNPPVSALKLDSKLTIAVNIRAQELIELYDPNHLRPNGTSCMTVLTEQGISYRTAGENIAWIDSRETSGKVLGEKMFTSWFNSAGHKRNMLDPNFQYIGVGVSCYGTKVYGAQLFIGR